MNATQLSKDLPESATWLNAPPATLMHFQGRPLVLAFVNAASAWCGQRLQELQQWLGVMLYNRQDESQNLVVLVWLLRLIWLHQ